MRGCGLILILLCVVGGSGGAWAADCTLCDACLRSAVPPGPGASKPGEVGAALIVGSPADITQRVTIRIIRVADDDGSDPAPLFGDDTQQAIILDHIDTIWAQAGIDVRVTFRSGVWRDTFANRGDESPRPQGDLSEIRAAAIADGVTDDDPLTLNVFMVRVVPGFAQQSGNTANGLAYVPGNGIAMWAGPNLPDFGPGREVVASVLAHEIGHNLGLPHIVENENLMQSGGSPTQGERLNGSQISTSLGSGYSRLLRSIAITLNDGAAVVGQAVDFANASLGSDTIDTDGDGVATAAGLDDLVETRITFPPDGPG